jgi:F420-non-reducing hydrogenase iron-sulfur subunit
MSHGGRKSSLNHDPKIIVFACNWCSYAAIDLAGTSRMKYPASPRVIKSLCSGRIDSQLILEAFKDGADGVLVAGCHPGDCHYMVGNIKTLRRYKLLARMLNDLGIEKERFRMEWISASEADKFVRVVKEMVETIQRLPPMSTRLVEVAVHA